MDGKHFPKSPSDLLPKEKTAEVRPDWKTMEREAMAWAVNYGGGVVRG